MSMPTSNADRPLKIANTRPYGRCRCAGCLEFFANHSAFKAHRRRRPEAEHNTPTIPYGAHRAAQGAAARRRCKDVAEMISAGMAHDDDGFWIAPKEAARRSTGGLGDSQGNRPAA